MIQPIENPFTERMSKETDEELIKIVTFLRNDYQELAVDAAELEINKRGISTLNIEETKSYLANNLGNQKSIERKKVSSFPRFLHYLIDSIALLSISLFLFYLCQQLQIFDDMYGLLSAYVIFATTFFGYYIYMEYYYQKTLGKMITSTKVVTRNGQKPTLRDIVGRTFCRLIPFDTISFLFSINGFHDSFSNTIVIKDK